MTPPRLAASMTAACLVGLAGAAAAWAAPAGAAQAGGVPEVRPAAVEDARRAMEKYFRDNPWSPLRAFARYDFTPRPPGGPEPSAVIGSAPGTDVRLDGPGVEPRHVRLTVLEPARPDGPWRFRIERLSATAAIRIAGEEWAPPAGATGGASPDDARVVDEE